MCSVVNDGVVGELIAPVAWLVTWEPSDGLVGSSTPSEITLFPTTQSVVM